MPQAQGGLPGPARQILSTLLLHSLPIRSIVVARQGGRPGIGLLTSLALTLCIAAVKEGL
jgi:hypothetical protein